MLREKTLLQIEFPNARIEKIKIAQQKMDQGLKI
jgi:hypothetical protein